MRDKKIKLKKKRHLALLKKKRYLALLKKKRRNHSLKFRIEHYLKNFYGYGSWDSPYWFVGLEEGTGTATINHISEVGEVKIFLDKLNRFCPENAHINSWNTRDTLLDNKTFQKELYPKYFNGHLQATHKRLIQVLLTRIAYNKTPTTLYDYHNKKEEIRTFQKNDFGSHKTVFGYNNCVIELLPVPVPDRYDQTFNCNYAPYFSKIFKGEISDKQSYINYCFCVNGAGRLEYLKKKISTTGSKTIIFYVPEMFSCIKYITDTIDKKWDHYVINYNSHYIHVYCYKNHSTYILIDHPTRSNRTDFWTIISEFVKIL